MAANGNECAFPMFDDCGRNWEDKGGLTKREYFVALALQGILSNPSLNVEEYSFNLNACLAIEQADILIHKLNRSDTWEGCD